MSKPISISFGKAKSTAAGANISTQTPTPAPQTVSTKPKLLGHDSDDDAELKQPIHEAVTGFAADGAILGARAAEKELLVIKNAGNGDWRKRRRAGRNLLPDEVQAQDGNTAVVEKDEVSKASGLQYAKGAGIAMVEAQPSETTNGNGANRPEPAQERTEDEIALQALLRDGEGGPKSTAVILQRENSNLARPQPIDELGDYRADVASRPDSATLDEYEVMPVEEFGLALLRGMGTKRKANGQVASRGDATGAVPKVVEPRPGYLGIGAKPAPGIEEIGAWGKAAMRRGMRSKTGDGLYTPVMLKDKRTGEMITEEELEARKLEAKKRSNGKEEDWRDRRDRNLERRARDMGGEPKRLMDKDDKYRDQMNAFSRNTAAQRGDRIASSHNDRSRSTDRRRRDDESRDEKYRGRSHDGDRDRERERERKREREREMEREMEMGKEREKDRRRDKYRDDDRHRSSSSRNSRRGDREMKLYADDDGRRGRWRS